MRAMKKADYGIDAPVVVRNLFVFSVAALFLVSLSFLIETPFWFWLAFGYSGLTALCLLASGCWMLHSTRIAKPKIIARMVRELNLKGHETVLDLGCGRGLLAIEAAKRVPNGKVCAVDLWTEDQSGNELSKTLENAHLEGVKEKIELKTADIRTLPYPDGTFDTVVSSLVIHNIPDAKGREEALSEMLRVLKPGGQFSLIDIHFGKDYAQFLSRIGIEVSCSNLGLYYCLPLRMVRGKKK